MYTHRIPRIEVFRDSSWRRASPRRFASRASDFGNFGEGEGCSKSAKISNFFTTKQNKKRIKLNCCGRECVLLSHKPTHTHKYVYLRTT